MPRTRKSTRRRPRSNPRGVLEIRGGRYGFVRTAEGEFFVPEGSLGSAFDGDLVELVPVHHRGGGGPRSSSGGGPFGSAPEARVVGVIDRAHDSVVGRYEVAEPFGVVVPEDPNLRHDIFTMRADNPDIPDGALVRVKITTFPDRHTAATGVVEEVLGLAADDDALAIDLIIAKHKLETAFSDGALQEAAQAQVDEASALKSGYRDLRDRCVFTIDPADAKDYDDALSLDEVPLGSSEAAGGACWRLGVHIADVSHYVRWESSLDLDARRRATSVYLVDRVIPMLPPEISDDICSLRPGETRRAMTVDLYLNSNADLVRSDIYPSLIASCRRFTYDYVQEVLQASGAKTACSNSPRLVESPDEGFRVAAELAAAIAPDTSQTPEPLADKLCELSRIAKKRAAQRRARGGIDFSTVEAKVQLDEQGAPVGVDVRRKTDATELVEEAMIFANEVVARTLDDARFFGIYRVHEQPLSDNLAGLVPVLREFSWFSEIDQTAFIDGNPHAVAVAVRLSEGRAEEELVSSLVLRSMKRAVYKPTCDGHYGLASAAYAHFTSPIRRYPDLVVHRMLKALTGADGYTRVDAEKRAGQLTWLSEHSSAMERVADQAARDSQEYKLIEYMQQFVGQTFPAVISGVASYGLFARLENTAEGAVPMRSLGEEYFMLDSARHCLVGTETGFEYRLGDPIMVTVKAAEARTHTLEFRLVAR